MCCESISISFLETFNNNNNKIKNPSVYDNFKTKQTTSTLVSQSSLTQKQQQQQQPQYHHQTHQLPQQQNKLVSEDENTNIQQINTPPSATDLHIHTSTAAAITRSKIMEFQSRFIRDMIQSHPLYFYTCMHPLVVKTVKSNNNEDKVLDYSHVPPTASCYFPIPQIGKSTSLL